MEGTPPGHAYLLGEDSRRRVGFQGLGPHSRVSQREGAHRWEREAEGMRLLAEVSQ